MRRAFRLAIIGISALFVFLLVSLVLFVNPLVNSAQFKSILNRILSSHRVNVDYRYLDVDLWHQGLFVRGLKVSSPNFEAHVENLEALHLFSDSRRALNVDGGYVFIVPKSGRGGGGGISLIALPALRVSDLRVKIGDRFAVVVRSLVVSDLKKGHFVVESPGVFLAKGSALREKGDVHLEIEKLSANTLKLSSLLSSLGVKVNLPIMHKEVKIRIFNGRVDYLHNKKLLRVSIKGPVFVNALKIEPLVSIIHDFSDGALTIEVSGVRGTLEDLKRVVSLFARVRALERVVYPMVKGAFLEDAHFKVILVKKRGRSKAEKIVFSCVVKNGVVAIPHTRLVAKGVDGRVLFKNKKVTVSLLRADIGGLSLNRVFVVVDLSHKPTVVKMDGDFRGDAGAVYRVLERLPLKGSLMATLNAHRLSKGVIKGRISFRIGKGLESLKVNADVRNAVIEDSLVRDLIFAERVQVHLDLPLLRIKLAGVESSCVKGGSLGIEIGRKKTFLVFSSFSLSYCLLEKLTFVSPSLFSGLKISSGELKAESAEVILSKRGISRVKVRGFVRGARAKARVSKRKWVPMEISGSLYVDYPLVQLKGANLLLGGVPLSIPFFEFDVGNKEARLSLSVRKAYRLKEFVEKIISQRLPVVVSHDARFRSTLKFDLARGVFEFEKASLYNSDCSVNVERGVFYKGGDISLDLHIKAGKDMRLSLVHKGALADLSSQGGLCIDRLFSLVKPVASGLPTSGCIVSNIKAHLDLQDLSKAKLAGYLKLDKIKVDKDTLSGSLFFSKNRLWTNGLSVKDPVGKAVVKGKGYLADRTFFFSAEAKGDFINLNLLPKGSKQRKKIVDFKGSIKFDFGAVGYKRWEMKQVRGSFTLNTATNALGVNLYNVDICGFKAKGEYKKKKGISTLSLHSSGSNSFDVLFDCLLHTDKKISGNFTYSINIDARGKDVLSSLNGSVEFDSEKGRVYKLGLLMKILQTLSLVNIITFKLPDFGKEGFAYDRMYVKGRLEKGVLTFERAFMESPAIKLVPFGKVNIPAKRLDLLVLAAPFTTVDKILSNIPLLGKVLTGDSGTFISFPLKVEGPWDNPRIVPLPPSAVGKGILKFFGRTLKTPAELLPRP